MTISPSESLKYIEETKEVMTNQLDQMILDGLSRPYSVKQMLEGLVKRYERWEDGVVPEDLFDDLVEQWHELDGDGVELHEFLRITRDQFKKAEEANLARAQREARYKRAEEEFSDRMVNGDCHGPNSDYWLAVRSRKQMRSERADSEVDPQSDGSSS